MLKLRENLPVIIEHYPFHESLNEKILKETAEFLLKQIHVIEMVD